MKNERKLHAAIIGAGPAGLFAAQKLESLGYGVALFNRDIKPGGLVEYGIFLEKYKIKNGFRNQFQQIINSENVKYFGNVTIGRNGEFGINDLLAWGFDAVLVAAGAQATKLTNLPGEQLKGVYHAKDLVYHYNKLPPFSTKPFAIGKRIAIIGAGNVMTDIAHYLINYCNVEEIVVVIRRGPAEVKFDQKEVLPIIAHLDMDDLNAEIDRVSPAMRAIGQDPDAAKHKVTVTLEKACPVEHPGRIIFRFLHSPIEILSGQNGAVTSVKLEKNSLELNGDRTVSRGTGEVVEYAVDNVIFAIGDLVSDDLELPMQSNGIQKSASPKFPIEGINFEVGDAESGQSLPGVFFAGWSRNPSTGLAGIARKDGVFAAAAVDQYLQSCPDKKGVDADEVKKRLDDLGIGHVGKDNLKVLEAAEKREAEAKGLEEFKFSTNVEMLKTMGLKTC